MWVRRSVSGSRERDLYSKLEPTGRFELPASGLRNRCSTTELRRHVTGLRLLPVETGRAPRNPERRLVGAAPAQWYPGHPASPSTRVRPGRARARHENRAPRQDAVDASVTTTGEGGTDVGRERPRVALTWTTRVEEARTTQFRPAALAA